jgi:heat shock protein HslJ
VVAGRAAWVWRNGRFSTVRTTPAAAAIFLTATAALVGCSSAEQRTLEGTSWQLVSIQSMDDAQGTTTVPDPSKFTVTFDKDGKALFQLDCNRGNGSYTTEPSSDGTSGSVTFGPIATTMMMCPQPSLDQQVSSALAQVRGYLFKDDQLHLSQFADGGVLSWKPV